MSATVSVVSVMIPGAAPGADKWITTQIKPPYYEEVLVCTKLGDRMVATWDGTEWVTMGVKTKGPGLICKPKYWQPLPAVPEELI